MPLTTSANIDDGDKEKPVDPLAPEVVAENPDEQPPFGSAPVPGHADIMHAWATGQSVAEVSAEGGRRVAFEKKAGDNPSGRERARAEAAFRSSDEDAKAARVEGAKEFVEARKAVAEVAEADAEAYQKDQEAADKKAADAKAKRVKSDSKAEAKLAKDEAEK